MLRREEHEILEIAPHLCYHESSYLTRDLDSYRALLECCICVRRSTFIGFGGSDRELVRQFDVLREKPIQESIISINRGKLARAALLTVPAVPPNLLRRYPRNNL
ncbi:MAG: hypothetical protein DRI48_05550 [Chloroflexi bacterium]|nr:MAG: hypothetical protein DRI48_05550 [Chloroflexota bacterium]